MNHCSTFADYLQLKTASPIDEIRPFLLSAEGYRWNSLEADGSDDPNVKTIEAAPQPGPLPTYPTSAKKPKDWNKLEKEVCLGGAEPQTRERMND